MMDEIKINTSYHNYSAINYYMYEYLLQTPVKEVLDELLKELDSTTMCKGFQVLPTSSWHYSDIVERYIRFLFRIPLYDFKLYNHYVDLLYARHKKNIEFEETLVELRKLPEKSINKTTKKKKIPNKFIRTETHNLFTGELMYDYTNFATGENFVSDNPNLLEELNVPKKKNKAKKAPKKEFGKIILNFKLK